MDNLSIKKVKEKAALSYLKTFLDLLQEKNPGLKTLNAVKTLDFLEEPYFNLNLSSALERIQSPNNAIPPEIVRDFALAIYDYYNMRSKWPEIVELGSLGLKACRQIGDSESMDIAYPALCNNLGITYRMMGDKERAMSFYKDALEKAIRNEEKSDALTNMCDIYRLSMENDKALECGKKAVELAKQIPDLDRQAKGLEFTALTHVQNKKFDEGIKSYKEALNLRKITDNLPEESRVLGFLADALRQVGSSSSLEEAITHYEQAIEIETQLANKTGLGRNYLGMGYTYQKQKKYQKAIDALDRAYANNEEIGFWRGAVLSKVRLAQSYAAVGNLEEAVNQANYVCDNREHLTEVDRDNADGFSEMLLQFADNLQQSGNTEKANKFTQSAIEFAKIERAKILDFSGKKVALAIAVQPDPEIEGETEVVVQVYPTGEESLPIGLKLRVELESDSDEEVAREGAKFVRLVFSELPGKTFRVRVSLANTVITEEFVV